MSPILGRARTWAGAGIATAFTLLLAVTAPAAPPTLTLSATDATIGQAIGATAELSEGPTASGQISFEVFGPDDPTCAGTALETSQATVSGEGQYASANFTPTAAGSYHWSARYPGDGENAAADAPCAAVSTVAKASPGLAGSASAAVVGTAIHDEVTLAGGFAPSGEVTFSVFAPADTSCATPLETTAVALSAGKATSGDFVPQQAGEFRWTASYEGDGNNEAASLGCNAGGQASSVAKAAPSLAGTATSTVVAGNTITDQATLSGAFLPSGEIVFFAYGPGDPSCGGTPAYEASVPVGANGSYSPPGFAPGPGLYRWTAAYEGDANNEAAELACGTDGQSSAVGTIDVTLDGSASGGTVGAPVAASATLREAANPGGQIIFRAFAPGDVDCSGAAVFSSTVGVSGNGSYRSTPFTPTRVGSFRWTAAYSGDPNHAPATVPCGRATSAILPARPAIAGAAPQRVPVGTPFRDAATLAGGFSPNGTVTFRIYGPTKGGCSGPAFVNAVSVNGNGTVSSDPFVPLKTGRYSFVASYSGDNENQAASEPCDSPAQVVQVVKRVPKVKPRARLIGRQISIRARLSGGVSPSGSLAFRLYGPGDGNCRRKPAFSGAITVRSNGTVTLARYLATEEGVYRLSVGYSGDRRNKRTPIGCDGAQAIRVRESA